MFLSETPSLPATLTQWGAILGLGLICSAYGFVVQPIAQRYTTPEKIGLIFSLEPVFSALLSWLFLHEILGFKGYTGAILIFAAVIFHRTFQKNGTLTGILSGFPSVIHPCRTTFSGFRQSCPNRPVIPDILAVTTIVHPPVPLPAAILSPVPETACPACRKPIPFTAT